MKMHRILFAVGATCLALAIPVSAGDVFNMPNGLTSLAFVAVGNAGNDPHYGTGYGDVAYVYNIGKFEVTTGQYTEFLNAVASVDTYGLYNANMWSDTYGCKIGRAGPAGSYTYSVAADRANRPVNFVSWGDAARFSNWLHNGQPAGGQDLATTEDGAYFLNGATSDVELVAVSRKSEARYVIPSENEWYKAAYYDPANYGGVGGYHGYPTGTSTIPSGKRRMILQTTAGPYCRMTQQMVANYHRMIDVREQLAPIP